MLVGSVQLDLVFKEYFNFWLNSIWLGLVSCWNHLSHCLSTARSAQPLIRQKLSLGQIYDRASSVRPLLIARLLSSGGI